MENLSPDDEGRIEDITEAHGYESLKKTQRLAFEDGILDSGNHLLVAETL